MSEAGYKKDSEVKKKTGMSPAMVGASVFEGAPRITEPLLAGAPLALMHLADRAPRIKGEVRSLEEIAQFTRKEVKAIKEFAANSGVSVPILGPTKYTYFDPGIKGWSEMAVDKGAKLLGKKSPIPKSMPHIGLSHTSLPGAFHEIGHASPIRGSEKLRNISLRAYGASRGPIGGISRRAIIGSTLLPPGEDSSRVRKMVYDNAPALVGATLAPALIEELRASAKALSGHRKAGLGTVKALASLAPAFGTYAGSAAATVMAAVLAKKIVKAMHDKHESEVEQEKTSAAIPGAGPKSSGALRELAASAWKIGGRTPPGSKSTKTNTYRLEAPAKVVATANPPSNKEYHKDLLKTLYNPGRGFRQAVVG
jgi:hypothetical protein